MSDNEAAQPDIQVALSRVMADIGAVGKDGFNAHGKFKFRGIDGVINAVSPALRKHGVIVTPRLHSIDQQAMTTAKGASMNRVVVVVDYVFTGPAGDTITARTPGESFDVGDKATAKAMSVAMRTALLQALALPTDEPDPDEHSYEAVPARSQAPAAGTSFDPQQALQQAWGSVERLRDLQTWGQQVGAPPEYTQQIQARITELEGASQNGQ